MKRRLFWIIVCLTLVLTILPYSGKAQGSGPVVDILGKPDTRSDPPNAKASISVIDRTTGRLVEGLSDANFSVEVSDEPVQATATVDTTGLAVVFVIDRGGIARRGSPRIGWAVDLTDNLLSMLTLDGSPTSDMAALIGIRGAEQGGLTPAVPFTDFDPNLIRNEFDALRTEVVDEVTPLYDGIDKAIEWIVENPDPQIQDKLVHHRPVIVVFSDGIDREFSSEAHETLIVNQCQENDILLYAVHIGGGSSDPGNMEALATQTNGVFVSYTPETQEETQTLFQNIVTQRQSYQVTFPLLRPLGDYDARIRVVDTPIGAGSDTATVSSRLQPPRITIIPPPDTTVTVPYSKTLEGFVRTTIPLSTQIEPTDGVAREPSEVLYFANGVRIGSSSTPPNYPYEWDVTTVVTPTDETQTREYSLIAGAGDPYLGSEMMSSPVNVRITWEEEELTAPKQVVKAWYENWWVILLFILLAIAIVVMMIMLIKTRGEIARKAVKSTTGVLKGVTQRLGAGGSLPPASAKLVVVRGPNAGREFRLATPIAKVGRDPQFSDFPLHDKFTSNPHFSIISEQSQFFIQDEGSTNGTKLNGQPIPKQQRVPLPPDSIIEAGQTRIQFKRLGGPTRRLSGSNAPRSPQPPPAKTEYAPPASPQQQGSQGPTQPWRPNGQ